MKKNSATRDASRPKRVLLAADIGRVFGVELLHGMMGYIRGRQKWLLRPIAPDQLTRENLTQLKPDGVVGLIYSPNMIDAVLATRTPTVNLTNEQRSLRIPGVFSDDRAVGRLAAEYALERGFRSYAIVRAYTSQWSALRASTFEQMIRSQGYECAEYLWSSESDMEVWNTNQSPPIVSWLEQLPKPVCVFTGSDFLAVPLIMACHLRHLAVPEAVSVIGVHNADIYCAMAEPSLTTVSTDQHRIGYEAARILDRLMAGKKVSLKPVIIPPRSVLERESTQIVPGTDQIIRDAMLFIRTNVHRPFGIDELAEALATSRRRIEQRFHEVLGRTPLQVIHQTRISLAKKLLADTDLAVKVVTQRCGFSRPDRLANVFKSLTGTTPAEFRANLRTVE